MELKNQKNKIFIGVAWPYVNGDIHVGHLAGYLFPADIFSRFMRLKGFDVLMVSGADCHGTPITVEAEKRGVKPEDIVNLYEPKLHNLINFYNLTFDIFSSTRTENHKKITQEFFLNLLKNGHIVKEKTLQYYSLNENKFLPDRYVEGRCKFCQAKDQRGDQCENCGRTLDPGDLIEPKSKLTGSPVILKETEHYALDYSKLQEEIENFVRNSKNWRSWVYSETIGFLKEGLKKRIITRDIDWGVEIPKEKISPEMLIENIENKRFYVWFEAVIGYFSASVEWAKKTKRSWEEFWLNSDLKHYYFMGKDNLIFHTIFWPGELIGQKKNYHLPDFPCTNQWFLLEGEKFSKSREIYIDALELGQKYGVDYVRFYIANVLPENKDTSFVWKEFERVINEELVNNIGNFIYRVLKFYKNKLNQKVKKDVDSTIENKSKEIFEKVSLKLERCEITSAFQEILKYARWGNQYLDKNKPWQDNQNADIITYNSLLTVNSLRILLWPFIPNSMDKLAEMMGLKNLKPSLGEDQYQFQIIDPLLIKIKNLQPLFSKIKI